MPQNKTVRTCEQGHQYYKSTDCPTCPVCEAENKPKDGLLSILSAPAGRALASIGVKTVKQLAQHTEKEIMTLHGMGPVSLPKLKAALKEAELNFRK
jgi:predicted RecB family nuclease